MLRYIPAFILHNYEENVFQGKLSAYVLLFDIADFTKIGTTMQKEGKPGVEELSRFLEVVFGTPINLVEKYGGFVSVFAGDAFCAIFPEAEAESIVSVVNSISKHFRENRIYKSFIGDIDLLVRQTICYGSLEWKIFHNDLQNEYVFQGIVMQEVGVLSLQKREILWSETAALRIGTENFASREIGYELLDNHIFEGKPGKIYHHNNDTALLFCHPRYREVMPQNEIRTAAFCFASLEKVAEAEREEAIAKLHNLANKYGALLNKLDFTDKGLVTLLLFGVPHNVGKTLERICSFSVETVESIPEIAMGISCGSVFAGYVGSGEIREYTAFGHPVNIAARLMTNARAGEVLADAFLWQEMNAKYDFDYLGSLYLKGIAMPMRYYQISQRAKDRAWSQENRFVGRDDELLEIKNLVDNSLQSMENSIIYIFGDAGIGKSRLVKQALANYSIVAYHKFNITCNTFLPKPLEAIKQIVQTYSYYNSQLPEEAGIAMFKGLWMALAQGDPELQRIESIIAWLLGYEWTGSIWNLLPAEEKPKQLRNAFISFMEQLAKTKPVLIYLDDGQWLAEESMVYLQELSKRCISPIIIVTACRYLENGEKVELGLAKHKRYDIELNSLSDSGSYQLIRSILRLENIPEATLSLITNRAMGNPLFIEQLTSFLMESGSLNEKGVITGEVSYLSSFSISDIISNRIDRLTEKVRECMFNASVLGTEFNIKVLSQMLKSEPAAELEIGVKNRIWRNLDELRYIFTHILIKDIIYQNLMSEKLQELHQTAAESMEIVFADKLDEYSVEIAIHFQKGKQLPKAAEYYNKAGCYFRDKYDFAGGVGNLKKALQIRELALGGAHTDTAVSLSNLAALYLAQGTYEQAEPLYLRALEIFEKTLGAEHLDTIIPLNNLAGMYKDQGKYSQAEPLYLRALEVKEKNLGTNHPDSAPSLLNLAHLYWLQAKYDQAEPLYQKAMDIYESVLEAQHPDTANLQNNQISIYQYQGRNTQNESLYQRNLKIREIVLSDEHPDTAGLLTNLASLYWLQGNYEQALPLYQRVLSIREEQRGVEHPDTAVVMNNLASLFDSQNLFDHAEPLYLRTLEIREKVLGSEHPLTAQSLSNLAGLYDSQNNTGQAEPLYIRALEIREKVLGSEHPLTAQSLNNLAVFYDSQGKNAQAEQLFLRALDIKEKVLGAGQPNMETSMNNLADLYNYQGRYDQAEQLFQRALKVWEKVLDTGHPTMATSMNNLAEFFSSQGKFDQAEQLYQRALKIWEKVMDTEHPHTLKSIKGLVDLYTKTGEWDKAKVYQERLDNILKRPE
ncbi:MAG: tetratricopeptide repeat protein [Candidatus Cloacimonetes bacterium]|nr:tetratricopeptide repeat protein [Candidatus Cloacimonadota bacterium]